jgi:hypothetical protein
MNLFNIILLLNVISDSALHDKNCLTSKEVTGTASAFAADGFLSSGSR